MTEPEPTATEVEGALAAPNLDAADDPTEVEVGGGNAVTEAEVGGGIAADEVEV